MPTESEEQPVTVVVINYNGKHHLDECLRSVQEADGPIGEVILVDDCSTDGSVDFVKERFPWVRVIRQAHNQGPAAARNAGIDAAQTPLVCLLDNDIAVNKGWLPPLVETMENDERAAMCTSRILLYEKPDIIGTDGDDAHFVGMPTRRHAWRPVSEVDDLAPNEVGAAPGISLLIDKSRMNGSLHHDADFFYNFEDLDFCLANRIVGRRCFVVPQSIVYHKYLTGGVPGLSASGETYASRRAFYVFRNRWLIILKFYALRTLAVLAPALFLFELVSVLFAVRRGVVRPYLSAWRSLVANLRSVLTKRRAIQAKRAVSDRLLLSAARLTLSQGTVGGTLEARLVFLLNWMFQRYWNMARHVM